jgi:hypothetical protein
MISSRFEKFFETSLRSPEGDKNTGIWALRNEVVMRLF